jgi:hypothetical protein
MALAGDDAPVSFTRASARRIADAVRKVEIGDRGGGALSFAKPQPDTRAAKKLFRIGTFQGSWAKGMTRVVTYKYVTSTPNTVHAINLFAEIGTSVSTVRNCAIALDAGTWHLVAAEC